MALTAFIGPIVYIIIHVDALVFTLVLSVVFRICTAPLLCPIAPSAIIFFAVFVGFFLVIVSVCTGALPS